jgi:serine/threonine-protein kinase
MQPPGPDEARQIGRYALFRPLATGGMATVHLGRLLGPVGFSRTVAIKRLHQHFAADPEFVAMFLDEARLAARVQHPNVVQTVDVVALEGELFIVMEYVHGESLSRLVNASKAHGAMDPKLAATILAGALHGLHAAHEAKSETGTPLSIVHRDVSPQNILVGVDGVARVLDFGVAKAANRIHVTQGGTIKGKFRYMPPEQLHNRVVDRRVDIYAAGVCLYEALTGRRYIEAEEHAGIVLEIVSKQPVAPSIYRADIPNSLDPLVLKAVSPDPNDRYATAEEMALAIEDAVGLASPARVGKWVTEVAAVALSQRAQRVAEVESCASGTYVEPSLPPTPEPSASYSGGYLHVTGPHRPPDTTYASNASHVAAALSATPAQPRVHPLWYAVAAGAVVVVMGVIVLVVVAKRGHTAPPVFARPASATAPEPPPSASAPPVSESPPAAPANADPPTSDDDAGVTPPEVASGASATTHHSPPTVRPHPSKPAPNTAEDLYRRRR